MLSLQIDHVRILITAVNGTRTIATRQAYTVISVGFPVVAMHKICI